MINSVFMIIKVFKAVNLYVFSISNRVSSSFFKDGAIAWRSGSFGGGARDGLIGLGTGYPMVNKMPGGCSRRSQETLEKSISLRRPFLPA